MVAIGDIGVSHQHVWTPAGQYPLKGTTWTAIDNSRTEEKIATIGIVLAIVGLFLICILSLLFLLIKDKRTTGYVLVTVNGPGWQHTASLPASSPQDYHVALSQVNWARAAAVAAG